MTRTRVPVPRTAIVSEMPSGPAGTAVLRLYDPIDPEGGVWGVSAKEFAQALDTLPKDTTGIRLHLSSPGGDVFDGLAILNALRQHPAKVTVVIDGLAASTASFIAMAGDEVLVAPDAMVMLHDAFGGAFGNAAQVAEVAAILDKVSETIAGVYASRTGTAEQWREVMREETWYSAVEAVAVGLADRVLESSTAPAEARNRFDLSIFNYAGREHAPAPKPLPVLEDPMDRQFLADLRQRLGVPDESADTTTILAALDQVLAEQAEADPTALARLEQAEAEAERLRTEAANRRRDEKLAAATKTGKITPAERKGWEARWEVNPTATEHALAALPEGKLPLEPIGYSGDPDDIETAEDRLLAKLFGPEPKVGKH